MTIYSLDVLLFLFGTSLLFHVQFWLLLPNLHTGFSRGRSGGLGFPSLSEFSTIFRIFHSLLWPTQSKALAQSKGTCCLSALIKLLIQYWIHVMRMNIHALVLSFVQECVCVCVYAHACVWWGWVIALLSGIKQDSSDSSYIFYTIALEWAIYLRNLGSFCWQVLLKCKALL